MKLKQNAGGPEFHEEGGAIVIGGPGTSRLPVYVRAYDLHALFDMNDAPGIYQAPDNPDPISASFQTLFAESLGWEKWADPQSPWSLTVWSGWLIVKANRDGHRSIEELLLLLSAKSPVLAEGSQR